MDDGKSRLRRNDGCGPHRLRSAQFGELGIDLHLSYTYQKAQDFTDKSSDNYGGQIPYVPWHSGSAILSAEYGGWYTSYSFIYTGERYESSANIPENYAQPWQ